MKCWVFDDEPPAALRCRIPDICIAPNLSEKRSFLRGTPKPKKQRLKWVKSFSKLILDFSLAKGKCTVEFREGS
jgi:hypothetical protein